MCVGIQVSIISQKLRSADFDDGKLVGFDRREMLQILLDFLPGADVVEQFDDGFLFRNDGRAPNPQARTEHRQHPTENFNGPLLTSVSCRLAVLVADSSCSEFQGRLGSCISVLSERMWLLWLPQESWTDLVYVGLWERYSGDHEMNWMLNWMLKWMLNWMLIFIIILLMIYVLSRMQVPVHVDPTTKR